MKQEKLNEILEKHKLWLSGKDGGERASLRYANLSFVDLSYADLSSADLEDICLCAAVGNMENIKSIFVEQYPITYTENILQIGCERHLISDWKEFSDETILRMDGKDALKFWKKYKELIFKFIELSPATPTS